MNWLCEEFCEYCHVIKIYATDCDSVTHSVSMFPFVSMLSNEGKHWCKWKSKREMD